MAALFWDFCMILILNLEVHRWDYLSALRIPVTITQQLSSHSKLRKLSVILTLIWLWKVKNFLCDSIRQISFHGEDLPAGHGNNKLAVGISPPGSVSWQYDWLTKITSRELERKHLGKFKYFKELKNYLFPWFVHFEASARTFLQGKGVLLKLL